MLYVYTFNGGRYDFNLIHKYFVSIFKQKKLPSILKIKKNGSKILNMKIPRKELYFQDILDMLGAGCNLAEFAELTQQTDMKMNFPFKYFTSMKSLEEKNLPVDKKYWFNDLTQEPYTDDQIAEAFSKFKQG